jgi:hypothetical protein
MMLKPSLSFAGPREYRWQGLEVPVMMGKRRGTAQIITASPTGCAASNRHKNLLLFSLSWVASAGVCLHSIELSPNREKYGLWQHG